MGNAFDMRYRSFYDCESPDIPIFIFSGGIFAQASAIVNVYGTADFENNTGQYSGRRVTGCEVFLNYLDLEALNYPRAQRETKYNMSTPPLPLRPTYPMMYGAIH